MTIPVESLRDLIETERERFGVPGVAVAVVQDGEILISDGFGASDLETGTDLTAGIHFPIASDSKAFTAATLCLLADEGALDLDAPIREHIPWFEMADPHATALVSARDLLSHRTGLPRHDLVWYGQPGLSLEDFVRRLRYLPLSRQLRQTWQYNNLCFMTAGYLTEVLTGQPWADAVRDRLLLPLGMSDTVFNPRDPSITALATPYNEIDGEMRAQHVPEKDHTGPAGGVVSTASDMAKWLVARVGGAPDVLSETALQQLHGPAMLGGVTLSAFDERQPMGYALGCQVESYRGQRTVRHGGNLIGFSSDVCIVPGSRIGIAVLTNRHGTSLRDALALMIIDRLRGLEPVPWGERYHELMTSMLQGAKDARENRAARASNQPAGRPLEEYTGRFEHPAYGEMGISLQDGTLVPDWHDLGPLIELRHQGHDAWEFYLVEFQMGLPLVFQQDAAGEITGFAVHIEPMVPPMNFTRVPTMVDPALRDALIGDYEMGPHKLKLRLQGDQLVATVPMAGQVSLQPTAERVFASPEAPSLRIQAEVDDSGAVTRLLIDPIGTFDRATT